MRQLRLFVLLLQPSIFSFTLITVLTGALLAGGNWSGITNSRLLYDYLSIGNVLDTTPESFTVFFDALMRGQAVLLLGVLSVAIVVSLLVYLFLDKIEGMLSDFLASTFNTQATSGQARGQILAEIAAHLIFRAGAFVGWGMYSALFVALALPYLVFMFGSGIADLNNIQWEYVLPAYILLWWALHMHVVFLRLFLLRPRVFGGSDVIAAGLE